MQFELDPQLVFYVQLAITAVAVLVILFVTYTHRKAVLTRLKYWSRMARGKHVADDYLVYEGDDWDDANAPKKRKKADRIDNLLFADIAVGPYVIVSAFYLLPQYTLIVAGILFGLPVVTQVWKYFRVIAEVNLYSGSLNFRIFYQTIDGREGEVVLERCRVSDRVTMKPRELLRALETAEHIIRSGIDERVLTAKIGKEYLTEGYKEKLDELEKLSSSRDQEMRDALTSVAVLRKYFSFGKDDAELQELFDAEIRRLLDEIAQLMKTKHSALTPEQLISAFTGWRFASAQATEDLKNGKVTPDVKQVLDTIIAEARAKDDTAKRLLQSLEVVKKYHTLGVLQEPGEKAELNRYEPHIYSVYPDDGDLKRRCVLVFPVPIGQAVSKDSKVRLRLDYSVRDLNGSDLEAIRLDETLEELIVNGQTHHGVHVELPDGVFAVPTNVPVFVITRADNTEEMLRRGQRITMPPALIGLFVKAVHSVIDYSWLAQKLAKAYSRIRQLEEGKEEDETTEETEQVQRDLDLGILVDTERPAPVQPTKARMPSWELVATFVCGLAVGLLTLFLLVYYGLFTIPRYVPTGGG